MRMGLKSLDQQLHLTDVDTEVGGQFKDTHALTRQLCTFAPYLLLFPERSKLTFLLSLV